MAQRIFGMAVLCMTLWWSACSEGYVTGCGAMETSPPVIAVVGRDSLTVETTLDTLQLFLNVWYNQVQDTLTTVIVDRQAGLGDTLRFHCTGRGWKTNPNRTMDLNRMFIGDTLALWLDDGRDKNDSLSMHTRVLRKAACVQEDFRYRIDTLRVLLDPAKEIHIANGR